MPFKAISEKRDNRQIIKKSLYLYNSGSCKHLGDNRMNKKERITDPCDKKVRKFNGKSFLSIFLSVLMLLTSIDYMQIQAQEINVGEAAADTESVESTEAADIDSTEALDNGESAETGEDGENPIETENTENPEDAVRDEETEEIESTQNPEEAPDEIQFVKTSEGAVVLSSFEPLSETESHIVLEEKGTLEEVLSMMPSALKAYAFVQTEETETALQELDVPVNWECREDYDNTELESYVFLPEWDNTAYYYESGIPIIVISIAEEINDGDVATQEELQAALAMGISEITLTEDIALTGTLTVPASADTVLDGNGFSLKRGTDENGVFTGTMIYLGGEDYAEKDYGKLTLTDICIDGTTPEDRADSSVIINFGSLILDEGAVIRNNTNYGTYSDEGADALIRAYGGGIQVYGDLQVTEQALIAGNFANEFGGGVYLEDGAQLFLFADVIVANRVAESTGYGADLYAASGSTVFYDSSIDMEKEGFYICEGADLICLQAAVEEYAEIELPDEEVRNDGKVEVYVSVAEGSGYSPAQLTEIEDKLEALGYSVISKRTNIDVTDFRDWYVFDHYDTYEKCWGKDADRDGVPDEWNARYGGNPRRKYYPCTEGYVYRENVYDQQGSYAVDANGNYIYAQPENPVYTIADWLASDEYYGKYIYRGELCLAQFKEHIYQGMQGGHPMMMFVGYGNPAYIDFMFYDPESNGEKVVDFDVDSSLVNVHTLTGAGFLVNTGIKDNKLYGYLVYYEYVESCPTAPISLSIYKLNGIDVDSFHNGIYDLRTSKNILGSAMATYSISSSNWNKEMSVQINITSNKIEVRQQPKNALTSIDQIKPVLSKEIDDTGYSGFGPLVAYTAYGHNCCRASSFTYSNIAMYYTNPTQEGQNMLQSLEKADFTQEGTQKYFVNLFGNSGLDYNNASVEAGLYQEYLKLMQVEGVALITDRDTPFEEYLGESGVAGSNLYEVDRGVSIDELVARIQEYVDQQTTTYMQNKLQSGEGDEGLTSADPKQSVGNCWLKAVTDNQQIRTIWGDSLTDDGYTIQIIDDISYYYGDKSGITVSYEILKPGASNYEPLPAASFSVGKDAAGWPMGQYTVRQTISSSMGEATVHGYAYFDVERNDDTGHTHTWGEYTIDKEPTCTENGHKYRECKTCGERQEAEIPALGHSPEEEWSSDEANHWHECIVCGEEFDKALHDFGDWIIDREPTCTEAGHKYRECQTCGEKQEEEVPASGHSLKEDWSSNETDHWHDCSVCGEKFDTASHDFGDWITDREPTCTEEGHKYRECNTCGEKQGEEIQASGHSPKEEWDSDEANHWHACSVCGEKLDKETHDAEDWSSNETDHWHVCDTCGESFDLDAHEFDEWITDQEATEDEEGARHRICSTCEYIDYGIIPTIPHQHIFGVWLNNETSHWRECRCGEKSEVALHSFEDWILDQEATEDEDGSKHRVCSVGEYTEYESIKLGSVTKREDCGENVPPTVISMQLPDLAAAVLQDDDMHVLGNGSDITIVLTVDDADDNVSEEDKAAVASQMGSYKLGQYFDVNLYKEMNDERVQITETDNKIRLMMTVPDRLENADDKISRSFAMIRVHDGNAVLLNDLDSEDGTVTIDTDLFSIYALVYTDKEVSGNDVEIVDTVDNRDDQIKENVRHVETVSARNLPEGQRDPEPRTSHTSHIELYATIALIEGLSYLMLMFTSERGMTEKKKKELISILIEWAKEGGALPRLLALAAIFVLLAYYHSIGKQVTEEWTSVCDGNY